MSACFIKALFVSEFPERIDVVSETLGGTWSPDDKAARAAALPPGILGDSGGGFSGFPTPREESD